MTHRGPFQPLLFCDSVKREHHVEGNKAYSALHSLGIAQG